MTVTLDPAPNSEELLSDLAGPNGQHKEEIASSLLAGALERAAHECEVEAILMGLEDSMAGRVTPLADWEARFRSKHHIRGDVEPMTDLEAESLSF